MAKIRTLVVTALVSCTPAKETPRVGNHVFERLWQDAKKRMPLRDEEAKALYLAKWVVDNSTNKTQKAKDLNDRYQFLPFFGRCGERSGVFKDLATRAGIETNIVNIYNFGKVGGGHTFVESKWNGRWHLLDVTYGGYFGRPGGILSVKQVLAAPVDAYQQTRIFGTGDDGFPGVTLDNGRRFRNVFSLAALKTARSISRRDGQPVTIEIRMSSHQFPLRLGKKGAGHKALCAEGIERKVTERAGELLFYGTDRFHPEFWLSDLKPGTSYRIAFGIEAMQGEFFAFEVESNSADITSRTERFSKDDAPKHIHIDFEAKNSSVRLLLRPLISRHQGVWVETWSVAQTGATKG